ncbi:MAG: hypothetical protein GXP27_09235 [Planctomycetes bacterium]|nr:hypothetical protein [Planctomycetota bacterium]
MRIERRRFVERVLTAGAALAGPLLWFTDRALPRRYAEAMRACCYPGPLRKLRPSDVTRPGRWRG